MVLLGVAFGFGEPAHLKGEAAVFGAMVEERCQGQQIECVWGGKGRLKHS